MRRAIAASLAFVGLVHFIEYERERTGLVVRRNRGNLLQARRLAKCANETAALLGRFGEGAHLGKDEGPGINAGDGQNEEHSQCNCATILEHLDERAGSGCRSRGRRVRLEKKGKGSCKNRRIPHLKS